MYKCYYSNCKTWWKYGAGDCGHGEKKFLFLSSSCSNAAIVASDGKIVYMKVVGPDHYSCEMGYIRHLKVMTKEKYLIIGHM